MEERREHRRQGEGDVTFELACIEVLKTEEDITELLEEIRVDIINRVEEIIEEGGLNDQELKVMVDKLKACQVLIALGL